jgi:ABC-type multidrug transport system fused ATPase/permease subunit
VDIEPGQLVVIVGQNGSGKSSLLKLLPVIMQPSSGDVYIDDKLITEYGINQVRNAMAILSQDERMFPLSLRDNMLMGLTERAWRLNSQQSTENLIEYASRLGGSWDIMRNVGLNTVLDPVRVIRQSTECVGNGKVERAAYDELDRCAATVTPVKISGGERQRLLAYVVNPVSKSSLFNC